jgi:ferredoxin
MHFDTSIAVYALPLLALLLFHMHGQRKEENRSKAAFAEARAAGLIDPASLHPMIDLARCMGCGSCVAACPEGQILGLIDRKAELIEPSQCIGHGACKTACPFDAITLVFGTAERGVDIHGRRCQCARLDGTDVSRGARLRRHRSPPDRRWP